MLYRPGKGDIFSSKSFKAIEDMNKFLEEEMPSLGRKKRSKAAKEKDASDCGDKESD